MTSPDRIAAAASDVLVVVGLSAEARIAAGPGTLVVAGGGHSARLSDALAQLDPERISAVVSFGLAGALAPALKPGDLLVSTSVRWRDGHAPASPTIMQAWRAQLARAGLSAVEAPFVGVDAPVLGPAEKAALREWTGADAVDMESHLAAAFAGRHGLPFAAIRAISDAADHVLPPIAGKAMRPDGGIDLAGVVLGLLRRPGQLPALLATGRDAGRAFRQLKRVRRVLGPRFGL